MFRPKYECVFISSTDKSAQQHEGDDSRRRRMAPRAHAQGGEFNAAMAGAPLQIRKIVGPGGATQFPKLL
jgi:hypothetical protein